MQGAADGALVVAALDGRLTLETVHTLLRAARAETAQALILDMTRVPFIDSAGVGALVQLFVHRRGLKQKFALAGLTQQGKAVIEVCGLLKLIPCYESLAEAQQSLA
ncbi:MAG TPA: STAS domain-containing protein [Candidatus Dormibacteraeota bacterium]|nr:STAS domain-containing protein [Candidatus Dormibacteraeota bacterium]